MKKSKSSAPQHPFHDDMTFKPELFSDLLNPPLNVQLGRLEVALNCIYTKQSKASFRNVEQKPKRTPNYHCDICEENNIYKVPPNSEVKFTQFSKLTFHDMSDALFVRESKKYGSHEKLMKLVHAEQELFENFMGSLKNKFNRLKSKIPCPWFQYYQEKFQQTINKIYQNSANYRLLSTHVLNSPAVSKIAPSIEFNGQLLAYGTISKIKLPKLGQMVKTDIGVLYRPCKRGKQIVPPNSAGSTNTKTSFEHAAANSDLAKETAKSSEVDLPHASDSVSNENTEESLKKLAPDSVSQDLVKSAVPKVSATSDEVDCLEDMDVRDSQQNSESAPNLSSETEKQLVDMPAPEVSTSTGDNSNPNTDLAGKIDHTEKQDLPDGKNSEKPESAVYKHVKVAISQDLDVFITDVPFNRLYGKDQEDLTHDDVRNFLLGLKVAEFIADIDSLCHVFSALPPDFIHSFLFKIEVVIQEDKSKYFKISEPLPNNRVTAESIKQSVLTEIIIKSCRRMDEGQEGDANIAFMQYLDDCGALIIDRNNPEVDVKTQLQEFVEPLKFTSYLPWKNLNSKSLDSMLYSLFSVLDTNVIVHSEQPFMVNFEDSFEKAVIYVKTQYCYEYGLEELTSSEYASLYLKSLLLECVGAVVFHVDMKTNHIVHVDKFYVEELSDLFPRVESMSRLTTFFELSHTLSEGTHIYSHEIGEAHGVVYEELKSEHIQADLILNKEMTIQLREKISPIVLSRTKLTSWQRHNLRLPMCFLPRKNGTYLCHEFLSKDICSNARNCAFAHLSKTQLQCELSAEDYKNFIEDFERPKESKQADKIEGDKAKVKNPNFGKILHKKNRKRRKGNQFQKKASN